MSTNSHRLSAYEKIGYSLGDAAANLVWRGALAFLAIFYTDTYGLDAAAVGLLLLVVRLSDGVTDIIMGMVADRTSTRWGKFRPWVLFSAPALGLFMVLTFTTPDLSPGLKLAYAYAAYICLTLAYTMNNVPYSALMGVMTPSNLERTSLSSWRFAGAFFGGFLVMVGTPLLVDHFGAGDDQKGYQYTMYLFAVLLVILLVLTFASTKERIQPHEDAASDHDWADFAKNMGLACVPLMAMTFTFFFSIRLVLGEGNFTINIMMLICSLAVIITSAFFIRKLIDKPRNIKSDTEKDFSDLLTNAPWVILLAIGFLFMMFTGIKIGAAAYYFEHYISDGIRASQIFSWWPNWMIHALEENNTDSLLLSAYFACTLAVSVVAALCTGFLARIFGKKTLFIASLFLGGFTTAGIYFLGPEQVGELFTLAIVSEFFAAILPVLFFSMLGDAADYSEWKNNRRATGLIYSAGTFINKTGGGFAGALMLVILGAYGYVGTDESTIALALPAVKSLMSWIPAIFAVVAGIVLMAYPLTKEKMAEIEADLIKQRA